MDAFNHFVGEVVAAQVQKALFRRQMTAPPDPHESRRKRLLWRSSHRGIKEMDLLMGGFAVRHVGAMSESQLTAFEVLIEVPDQELFSWVMGEAAVPDDFKNEVLPEFIKFRP
jgi:antitoxin CptB